jgi:hypothetical protein
MFVAGDDDAQKPAVLGLVGDLGFEAVDAGPLRVARLLEPYGMLWIDQALIITDFAPDLGQRRGNEGVQVGGFRRRQEVAVRQHPLRLDQQAASTRETAPLGKAVRNPPGPILGPCMRQTTST